MTALDRRAAPAPTPTDEGLVRLFRPRGVLVVGASADPEKLGGAMAAQLSTYQEPIALINPRGGDRMSATLAEGAAKVRESGGEPDLAVLCVPAALCPDVVREGASLGVRAALICAGGFAEIGPPGQAVQEQLVAAARDSGVRVLGPNTSGFFVPAHRLCASFVPAAASITPGRIAVLAASGGLNHALSFSFQRERAGISLGIGIGAGFDVDAVDVLRHLENDPTTSVVALHLETVSDGPRLLDALRDTVRRKPVVALVVGQHDVGDFARSHTGALATSWRTTRAVLREAGAVVVDRPDDLVAAAIALSTTRLRIGSRGVGLVTAQAGPGLLIADALHDAGVTLPRLSDATQRALGELLPPMTYQANPVDTGRPGAGHAEVLRTVAEDPGVDLVATYGLVEPVVDLPGRARDVASQGHSLIVGVDGTADEVFSARNDVSGPGVTVLVGAQSLATGVCALVRDADREDHEGARLASRPTVQVGRGPWTESQAKDVLSGLGVAGPERRLCADAATAHAALDELGGPVAVKVSDPNIVHKSDVGGVFLGISDHAGLDAALSSLGVLSQSPVLIEQMAKEGVDLVVGARRDPVFGPVVVLGVGGIATEVYADVAIATVLATRRQLLALPDQLMARQLIEGFRGMTAGDREALADVLEILGSLLAANDHLIDVEINPLRWTGDTLVALDAVLIATEDSQ